jgi:MFS transporter, DHA1 family, inner membrane transport protein
MESTRIRGRPGASAVLFLSLFAAQAALLVLSPILTQVAEEFEVTVSAAAQLRSVSGITAGLAALFLAIRGDRFQLSRLLSIGLILLAVGSLASAVAPGFALLIGAQIIIGLGLAAVLSGGLAASEAWATEGEGARVLSWALVGQPVAWVVGQPIVGAVASTDWRWAWIAVPLAFALIALAAVNLRDPAIPEGKLECDPAGLWRLPGVKSWAASELAAFSAWAGTLVYAGAFFVETYGVSVGLTGLILGLVAAAYLPGNFLGRRWLKSGASGLLVISATALAITVAVFGGYRPGVAFSTSALALAAFLAGARTIAGASLGLELAEGRRLAAMSVRTAMLQFGYLIGTALGGMVLPLWGYAGVGWTFAGLFALAAAVHLRQTLEGTLVHSRARAYLRRG